MRGWGRERVPFGGPLGIVLLLVLSFATLAHGGTTPSPRAISVVLIGLLATLAIGAALRARGTQPVAPGPPGWAVASLLLLGVIGAWRAFYPHEALARLSIWAAAAGCYAITVLAATGRSSLQQIRMGLCALGSAAALFGLLAPGVLGEPGRDDGPFVNPNHLAALLAAILPLAMAGVIVHGKQSRSRTPRAIFLAGTLLCASGLIATQSRGGALAAAAGVLSLGILLALRGEAGGRSIRGWAGLSALVLMLAAFPLAGAFGDTANLHRFHPSEAGTESSAGFRISIWRSSLQAAAEGGPLGWGLGTYAWVYPAYRGVDIPYRVSHAHSDWLEGAVELGWAFPPPGPRRRGHLLPAGGAGADETAERGGDRHGGGVLRRPRCLGGARIRGRSTADPVDPLDGGGSGRPRERFRKHP